MKSLLLAALLLPVLAAPAAAHPPYGFAVDEDGNVYFLAFARRKLFRIAPDGEIKRLANLNQVTDREPHSVTLGPDGALYVAATYEPRAWRIPREGGAPREWKLPLPADEPGLAGANLLQLKYTPEAGWLAVLLRSQRGPGGESGQRYWVVTAPPPAANAATPTAPVFRVRHRDGIGAGERRLYASCFAPAPDGSALFTLDADVLRLRSAATRDQGRDNIEVVTTLGQPWGLVHDPKGGLVVADSSRHAIFRVLADGTTRRLAGTGTRGGRNGPGAEAEFDSPHGVAVGPQGRVYVSEYCKIDGRWCHRFRVIAADGTVTRLAVVPGQP
ncbi:MAG: hypothetical protein AAF628_02910 [Planctomycetota bacterium]